MRTDSVLVFSLLLGALSSSTSRAQDPGAIASEFHGRGVAITIIVHGPSGEPIASSATVSVFRNGSVPAGQAETAQGRAELVLSDLGDFTVTVNAAGYGTVQKEISIQANGRLEVDIYLHPLSTTATGVPGRPLLAPKAKRAVDEGLQALAGDKLGEAQKRASEAARLAPSHPDVLYLQGLILLKQRDWTRAQGVLEQATQVDPAHGNAFSALGMALCNQGKYDAALAPLEKSLQLNAAASSWDTRWALAKAYYQQAHYDQALQMSQDALSSSKGKAPEIALLLAQSLTAVGRYEDAARALREFLRDHSDRREAATARRWLDRLVSSGKIQAKLDPLK